ncbi:MAG: hypothetical protein HFJ05_05100 [Eubacterium sp.]|nr:hypothetical protein [Eubacterium sp.]
MKRLMAALLTGSLVFQAWIGVATPVYGAEVSAKTAAVSGRLDETDALADEENGSGAQAEEGSSIEAEVRSMAVSPVTGDVVVRILDSSKAVVKSETLHFDDSHAASQSAKFAVSQGDYTVEIAAPKYALYTQDIHVDANWSNRILVCSALDDAGSESAAGWLRPGDVNGDGKINEADTDLLLTAVRQKPTDTQTDLNGDGRTDMVDLQYAVQSLGENKESQVEKKALVQNVQASEGTTIEGNVEDFLNKSGSITLKPANEAEEISKSNPVGMEFVLASEEVTDPQLIPEIGGITIQASADVDEDGTVTSDITDGDAVIVYVDRDGKEQEETVSLVPAQAKQGVRYMLMRALSGRSVASGVSVSVEADGSLVLDFGTQIAVKRVLIRITGTKKTEPLVNISKVEFVNNMEDRIPAPKLDIPTLNTPVSGDKKLSVSWNAQTNVTGYEIYISGPVKGQSGNETQIIPVSVTSHEISAINNKNLKNFANYTIKVRSVNGDWSSPWSNTQIGTPKPQSRPAAPDNVNAVGGYRAVTVSWKDMDDASGYMVYYKKTEEADSAFRPVVEGFTQVPAGTGRLTGTSYQISGLEDEVSYTVYVIGWNELGWGSPSLHSVAQTISTAMPQLPEYKLLNTSNGTGQVTAHITGATYGGHQGATMVSSPLDDADPNTRSAWGIVDNDYSSYWTVTDWDDGVSYPADDRGMFISLDDDYLMSYLTFAAANPEAQIAQARIDYWNSENPKSVQRVGASLMLKTDEHNNQYYIVKFAQPITANRIHLSLGKNGGRIKMMVGEIHFHLYDTIEEDIMALFTDEMHTTLRDDVTKDTLDALEARLNTPDAASGELHPLYSELELDLNAARDILSLNLSPAFEVDNTITASKDGHLGFGGLNAWQPLGRVLHQGETFVIYVGHNTKKIGEMTNLRLVMTQHHAESNCPLDGANLKVGRNEFTLTKQLSSKDFEHGGQIYIQYQANDAADKYAVRIQGGSRIPSLIVKDKTGEKRTEAIRNYVNDLESFVGTIEATHNEVHEGTQYVDYPYDQTNCILNATDIMMDEMMYSVPATQVWAGIANASDKVAKLDNALKAMEDTMTLFYQHKGLSDLAGTARGNNARPSQHLNIRYMRMFAGAFMYASGNHIGIEWGSTPLASAPNDWSGLGWGVAHEIGHNINQGTYAVAEVTNNYFAQLLTGKQRYTYENVYKKVTSGTVGRASNVFTQLALYWQLHLAYDNQLDDRHIYDNYEDQFNNLFFARVDTYSRNPKNAPQAGLAVNAGAEQNLMRLACAAANKNILPFFERWGMVPDEATRNYAALYGEAETKALYYVNEDARAYRISHPDEAGTIKDQNAVTASVSAKPNSNQVEIRMATDRDADLMLGYEISRSMISNGTKTTKVIGFVPIDTAASTVYVDSVASINNRVLEYEVRAVDKYLNYSKVNVAGSVKLETNGVLDKTEWTVETTMTSEDDVEITPDEDDPDNGSGINIAGKKVHSIDRIIDNDRTDAGTYHGTVSGNTATITLDMHRTEQVTALKYQGDAIGSITVEVSADGTTWTAVKADYTELTGEGEQIIWFDSVKEEERESWIGTYDARYVRLTMAQTGDISIQEIEICGPTGDNLEFMTAENGQPAIGVLSKDYQYGSKAEDVIPEGSLIFTGIYKGNPAYNVVMLYDTDGNVIGAKDGNVAAGQVIFADVPEHGELGETSNGTWVYYVEKGQWDEETLKQIQGVRGELYRVDDALTNAGERIVSDTLVITIPESLPSIELTGKIPE